MIKNKTKITYIITKASWGGAQKYVYDLTTKMSEKNFEVSVILGGEGKLKDKLLKNNIKVISFPDLQRDINILKEIKIFFSFFKILKSEKPGILHLNSSKAGFIGSIVGRICGIKKIIFTGHGWAFNEDRSTFSKLIFSFLHWMTILFSHKTIAVSKKTKQQIVKKFPFISKKIAVIYNGIEINEKDLYSRYEARELLFQKTNLFSKDINIDSVKTAWIGTIAELHKNKGIKYAMKAIKNISFKMKDQNKSIVYFVIGEGERRKKYEKYIKENNLESEVFLIGRLENAIKYLNAFDVFLLPSRTEAFPYVLLEAGLANLPVIASNVGGIPEIIEDMKCGILVPPKESGDIENALMSMFSDNEMRGKMAQSLGHKVRTEFSFERMFGETLKLYNG